MSRKVPGWGIRLLATRAGPQGQPEALVCPSDHEACFWADLREIARHRARVIYSPDRHDNDRIDTPGPDDRNPTDGAPRS